MTVADGLPPTDGAWPALDSLARAPCRDGLLFVDLETTGLVGGAGTYAFLVGCCVVRRRLVPRPPVLMSNPMVERSMLGAIAELAGEAGTVVTYNGKTFDLPLIETRYCSTGWKRRLPACRTWTCCTRRAGCGAAQATGPTTTACSMRAVAV